VQHAVHGVLHTVGIPTIVVSIALLVAAIFVRALLPWAIALFVLGWVFQFIGHAVERKPPEFLHDWRFLFVGLRWWLAKVRGRAAGRPPGS
jgi:uncharacterized membrane protein YGL010W